MTPAAPASPPSTSEPRLLRWLRSASAIGLALALTVITALAVVGFLPGARAAFEPLFSFDSHPPVLAIALTVAFVILLPLMLVVLAARRHWLTWRVMAVGWLAVLPVLGWVTWDEPAIRQPLPIEEFSPAFPGAEQSYAVLMQYSKQAPGAEAKAFATTKLTVQWGATSTREAAKWREWVAKNRAGLEADWVTLAPQRRWLGELAAFDRLGDLTPSSPDANIISFQVWRTLSQRTSAIATLQALDGRGDDAIATLLPMLGAGRKLQPSSRTLVRSMIGVVIERMTLETAALVLDLTPVSAATRARLAAALDGENAPTLARRLILVDYVQFGPVFGKMKLGEHFTRGGEHLPLLRRPLDFLGSLLFLPNATMNLYGDNVRELAALAEARELGKFEVRSKGFFENTLQREPGMKNIGGRMLLTMAVPAYAKVLESHWKTADLREAVRQRLAKQP